MSDILPFYYGQDTLTPRIALQVARAERTGRISGQVKEKVRLSESWVHAHVGKSLPVYGVNTGFGPLCKTRISTGDLKALQKNLLRSHSVGVGPVLPAEIVRLMLVLKVQALALGHSGVRLETLERILMHLENDVIPVVPSQGSVGASGDLAPLAHLFLPLIGLGQVWVRGEKRESAAWMQEAGIEPLELGPKEGLALINGTQFMLAMGVKILEQLENCLDHGDIIGAMTLEAMMGSLRPYQEALHQLRPYSGCLHVAHRVRVLLHQSEILQSHIFCDRVQDPYSIRCMPQVHGATRHAWQHLKGMVDTELNAVTDNPVLIDAATAISGGNFHGQPLALPMDYAAIAAAELGNISDRRTYLLLEGKVELPTLLMQQTGINSGFMIPQYTAAALVSENKALCFPSAADSIPTSLGQEDHVSMGAFSGRKALMILDNLEKILAVELLCAAQAFDFRRPLKSGLILEACHQYIRSKISHAVEDRVFAEDLEVAIDIIQSMELRHICREISHKYQLGLESPYQKEFSIY